MTIEELLASRDKRQERTIKFYAAREAELMDGTFALAERHLISAHDVLAGLYVAICSGDIAVEYDTTLKARISSYLSIVADFGDLASRQAELPPVRRMRARKLIHHMVEILALLKHDSRVMTALGLIPSLCPPPNPISRAR